MVQVPIQITLDFVGLVSSRVIHKLVRFFSQQLGYEQRRQVKRIGNVEKHNIYFFSYSYQFYAC